MLTRTARDLFRQSLFQVMIAGEYVTVNPMSSAKTQPARGMRDFLPADVRKREYVIGVIKEVYERYGFEPLETPAVENIETLMGKYGEEGNQLIFKILKRGLPRMVEKDTALSELTDLALRYDLTVPLARVVAEYRDSKLPKFFKRYQIQPVWRADRPARGRFREFYQCDVDVLDSTSMLVEAELCSAVTDVLVQLGFSEFTIRLNHRKVLTALFNAVGVPEAKHSEALVAFDKLDKLGEEGVQLELRDRGIATEALLELVRVVYRSKRSGELSGDDGSDLDLVPYNSAILEVLRKTIGEDAQGIHGLKELASILELTTETSAGSRIKVDPSLARGLSYYTGAILEIEAEGMAGSLGGGGRYDDLVGMFLGKDQPVPACGFSLGLERIIVIMSEREMFPSDLISAPADVMVLISYQKEAGEKVEAAKDALRLARHLRTSGLSVYLYPLRNVQVSKQRGYASKRGFPFVAVVGDDDRERGEVTIRNMRTGEEQKIERAKVVDAIRTGLK
jgi:histidyl-tRNA synthetase